jgi:hypothetical protein
MIVGYILSGNSSNEGVFFDEVQIQDRLCQHCGTCFDYNYAPASLKIHPSKKYDVSYTHDLRDIFSERFVEYSKEVLNAENDFSRIDLGHSFVYYMMPSSELEFDTERSKTRFVKPCEACGGYEAVVGSKPAFLKRRDAIGIGFFRTDVSFASGKSKHPLIIVGPEWKGLLESQNFRGLVFRPVFGID